MRAVRARRGGMSGRKLLGAAVGGLAMAAAAGATYQLLESWNSRRRYFPPGRFVEGADHHSILMDRANAEVTAAAIREIVEAARSGDLRSPA